jgi:hypothetical protein
MIKKTITMILGVLLVLGSTGLRAEVDAENSDLLSNFTAPVTIPPATLDLGESDREPVTTRARVAFEQANLAGIWRFHIWLHASFPLWLACDSVKIRSNGGVRIGSKCTIYDDFSGSFFTGTVNGGKFKLTQNGQIIGKLTVGTGDIPVTSGWMEKTKSYFHAVGVSLGEGMDMTAIKR